MHELYKSAGIGSGVTAQQLTELNTQLMAAQTAKARIDSQLAEALDLRKEGFGKESVPEVLRSTLIVSLKEQQANTDRRAAEMNAMYGERHPTLRGANAEAATAQAKVGAEVSKTIDGIAREARAADVRYRMLGQEFESLKERMGAVNDRSIGLDALERDAVINRNLLQLMLDRVKQSAGADVFMQANARLVSPAVAPEDPSSPPRPLIAVLGTLVGLMFGSAIVLLRQGGEATFRRADEIEATTGFPLFAMVPQTNARTVPSMQVVSDPASTFSEALRRVQVGIDLSAAAASSSTLLFASATPSEGRTVMVASLGRMLASNGRRTLLIDCDWRRPRLHQVFRCANGTGLAGLLTTTAPVPSDLIHHDALSGCDVLTAGDWKPEQAHFLGSERMRRLIHALATHYDSIILDTAPTLVAADALSLSRFVQRVVFVVRWDHTRKDAVLEALKQITDAQGQVAGVVLTRVESKKYRRYGHRDPFYEYSRPSNPSAT
jgi:capsular exopolysaccharide synthesis family protein